MLQSVTEEGVKNGPNSVTYMYFMDGFSAFKRKLEKLGY